MIVGGLVAAADWRAISQDDDLASRSEQSRGRKLAKLLPHV
jgi:hypothetical protein